MGALESPAPDPMRAKKGTPQTSELDPCLGNWTPGSLDPSPFAKASEGSQCPVSENLPDCKQVAGARCLSGRNREDRYISPSPLGKENIDGSDHNRGITYHPYLSPKPVGTNRRHNEDLSPD